MKESGANYYSTQKVGPFQSSEKLYKINRTEFIEESKSEKKLKIKHKRKVSKDSKSE
jgi:hypothetical protein